MKPKTVKIDPSFLKLWVHGYQTLLLKTKSIKLQQGDLPLRRPHIKFYNSTQYYKFLHDNWT